MLPWEHCLVCTKLSQDTPEQLKPPETNMGETNRHSSPWGDTPTAQGPRKWGRPEGCETVTMLVQHCRQGSMDLISREAQNLHHIIKGIYTLKV